jgi:DNA-binding MltR family transcriptional regulator
MVNRDKDEIEMSMNEIMDGETDLSCALLGASLIDLHLKMLLEKFFINGKTSERILSNTGFAGNSRARTDLAYVLGLINKDEYNNILNVLEIRNLFGYEHTLTSFASRKISKLCEKLTIDDSKLRDETDEEWNLIKFKSVCIIIIVDMDLKIDQIVKSELIQRVRSW